MAGVKGRSGGARAGAGRKPKPKVSMPAVQSQDPIDFLLAVQNDPAQPTDLRVRAAITAAAYLHKKRGDAGGKKEGQREGATAASKGRFAPSAPPKLVVNNR